LNLEVAPIPAPVVVGVFVVGFVLVYATVVGREAEEPTGSHQHPEAAELSLVPRLPASTATGLRSVYRGTVRYLRGFGETDGPVEASKRAWDPHTAALGIIAVAVPTPSLVGVERVQD